jgi:hypothetical protein
MSGFKKTPMHSPSRPATLNEARRALVDPDRCTVALDDDKDMDAETQLAMVKHCREQLTAARQASLAGRLFVIDHETLAEDWDDLRVALVPEELHPPFDVTVILTPNFQGACPLFMATRVDDQHAKVFTAIPRKNDEHVYWSVPGFEPGSERGYLTALVSAIQTRNLKPIGPPR